MSIEIEKKYRLPKERIASLRGRLADAGAAFVGDDLEENTIFGGGILDEMGAVLRIRRTQDRTVLTFKKRIDSGSDIKHQVEHESEFTDEAELREIVKELGFIPRIIYEKRRSTWNLAGAEIVLDTLPFGEFVEIEGPVEAIKSVETLIGIDDLEVEHETYPRLTARLGTERNGVMESRFESN
jgi:adenylate cyclase class 2